MWGNSHLFCMCNVEIQYRGQDWTQTQVHLKFFSTFVLGLDLIELIENIVLRWT